MHPLADMFADPRMAARPLVISGQERLGVDDQKSLALVGVDPAPSQPSMCTAEGESSSQSSATAAATLGGNGSTAAAGPATAVETVMNVTNRPSCLVSINSLLD